jgi:hypothetical protein
VLDRLAAGATEALRERAAAGTFSADLDADITAQALTGMFARVVGWWIEDPSRATREAMIESLVHIQLYGTAADAFSSALPGDGTKRKGATNG